MPGIPPGTGASKPLAASVASTYYARRATSTAAQWTRCQFPLPGNREPARPSVHGDGAGRLDDSRRLQLRPVPRGARGADSGDTGIPGETVQYVLDLDHPAWVEDSNFDIDRHVHRVGLRAPGGPTEMAEICGVLAGLPLDRRAPLWEMWVIEGTDGSRHGDRLAVLLKVHHAAADGVTFGDFLSLLCTAEPDPPPPAPVEAAAPAGPVRMALNGLARFVRRPVLLVTRVVPATFSAVVDIVRRTRAGRAMAAPFSRSANQAQSGPGRSPDTEPPGTELEVVLVDLEQVRCETAWPSRSPCRRP